MTFQVASSYDDVTCFLDRRFNHPILSDSFTQDDFAREYDAAFDTIAEELSAAGVVATDGMSGGDFVMSRYVDLSRAITVVADTPHAISPVALEAAHTARQRLPEEYVVCFDAHPTYVCVRRNGTVIGHSTDGDFSALHAFGFPTAIAIQALRRVAELWLVERLHTLIPAMSNKPKTANESPRK